jgi:hypothetical protein
MSQDTRGCWPFTHLHPSAVTLGKVKVVKMVDDIAEDENGG